MKLKIKKQVEEIVNITFPHYTKSICAAYCFKSKTECVEVKNGSRVGIEFKQDYPKQWLGEDEAISKEEFDLAFNEALEKIKNMSRG